MKKLQVGIAKTKKQQIEGMKTFKGDTLVFPFADNSTNVMTMKGMKEPLIITDSNGSRVVQPNEEIITSGQVIEKRMDNYKKKLQLGKLKKYQTWGEVERLKAQGFKTVEKDGKNITLEKNNPGSNSGNYNYIGGGNKLTGLSQNDWFAQLVASGMTPKEFAKNNGGTPEGNKAYADFYGDPKNTPASTERKVVNSDAIPILNSAGLKSMMPNIDLSKNNIQRVNPDNYATPKSPLIDKEKLKGFQLPENIDLGFAGADAFLNKPISPPAKQTVAHYTPEYFRPHLQPTMDAGTTAMRNIDRTRGNAMSKNANLANVAMQRAAGTSAELNRVDNLNVDLANNAQLKNIEIQGTNNQTLYDNAAEQVMAKRDRVSNQSEVLANVNSRVQGYKRDKAAAKLSQDQLEMMKAYYNGQNNATGNTSATGNATPTDNGAAALAESNRLKASRSTGQNTTQTFPSIPRVADNNIANDFNTQIPTKPNIYQPNITMPKMPVIPANFGEEAFKQQDVPSNYVEQNNPATPSRLRQELNYGAFGDMQPNFNVNTNMPRYQLGLKNKLKLKLKFNK